MIKLNPDDNIWTIKKEGGHQYFTFPTNFTQNNASSKIILKQKDIPGYFVYRDRISNWKFEGLKSENEKYYLYGLFHEGETLAEVIKRPAEEALPYLKRLVNAWQYLIKNKKPLFEPQSDLIIFTRDEGVLFLPVEITKFIHGEQPKGKRLETFAAINHPFFHDQERCSYAICTLIYKLLTGRYPFTGTKYKEIKDRMVMKTVIPPAYINSKLKEVISSSITEILRNPKKCLPTLTDWEKKLDELEQNGIEESYSNAQLLKKENLSQKKISAIEKIYKYKLFYRNKRTLIYLSGIIILCILAITYHFISIWLKPRVTKGYAPIQVVETFYHSINTMDFETMQDTVIDDTGNREITEATYSNVVFKMKQAYQSDQGTIIAGDWERQGKPKLKEGQLLYGISDLGIETVNAAPNPVFIVTFTKWAPEQAETDADQEPVKMISRQTSIKHKLFLKKDNEDWVIYRIDR
jgi:hypothetical protein